MCLRLGGRGGKEQEKQKKSKCLDQSVVQTYFSRSLSDDWPVHCAFLHDSAPSVRGTGSTQPSDKGSPSGEAMHGFEPTQAREGPLLLHKVF